MKKTTVEIDESLLRKAIEVSGAKTKKEAIEKGLRELIRKKNIEILCEELGTYEIDLTLEDLEKMRSEK